MSPRVRAKIRVAPRIIHPNTTNGRNWNILDRISEGTNGLDDRVLVVVQRVVAGACG
jgi:hypothetical protein